MRFRLTGGLAIAALCGATTLAQAAPPTVTPSPGYDRRLQESRSDTSAPATTTTAAPTNPTATTAPHLKKKQAH
jgi:hypothetical protein